MEGANTKLLFPGLKPFYAWAEPVSGALVRITAGLMILPHGVPKVIAGIGPTAAFALVKRGIQPAEPLAVVLSCSKRWAACVSRWACSPASSRRTSPSRCR